MTLKIVAVFPEGGEAAKNEKYVNCTENALGLRDWCKQNDAELVVTSSKDGSDSGECAWPVCILAHQFSSCIITILPLLQSWKSTSRMQRF